MTKLQTVALSNMDSAIEVEKYNQTWEEKRSRKANRKVRDLDRRSKRQAKNLARYS